MITGTLRNQIDKLWTEFWTGGITNPLTVIEQISFLMFSRLLDIAETRAEKRAARPGKPFKGQFGRQGAETPLVELQEPARRGDAQGRPGRSVPALPQLSATANRPSPST